MYNLSDYPKITVSISFERYPSTKKFLLCVEDPNGEVEVEVNKGVAMFKVDIFQISKFIVGGPREPYCMIPIKCLTLFDMGGHDAPPKMFLSTVPKHFVGGS